MTHTLTHTCFWWESLILLGNFNQSSGASISKGQVILEEDHGVTTMLVQSKSRAVDWSGEPTKQVCEVCVAGDEWWLPFHVISGVKKKKPKSCWSTSMCLWEDLKEQILALKYCFISEVCLVSVIFPKASLYFRLYTAGYLLSPLFCSSKPYSLSEVLQSRSFLDIQVSGERDPGLLWERPASHLSTMTFLSTSLKKACEPRPSAASRPAAVASSITITPDWWVFFHWIVVNTCRSAASTDSWMDSCSMSASLLTTYCVMGQSNLRVSSEVNRSTDCVSSLPLIRHIFWLKHPSHILLRQKDWDVFSHWCWRVFFSTLWFHVYHELNLRWYCSCDWCSALLQLFLFLIHLLYV